MSIASDIDIRTLFDDPAAFVAAAHAAGYRLARNVGWYSRTHHCGCVLGVAAALVEPKTPTGHPTNPGILDTCLRSGRGRSELLGMADGFDADRPITPDPGEEPVRPYVRGHEFGRQVAERALAVQGTLAPEPAEIDDEAERDPRRPRRQTRPDRDTDF